MPRSRSGRLFKVAAWLPYSFCLPVVSRVRVLGNPLAARVACYSFGRVRFRPLPAASLPSSIALPGIDIIHFAHRSGPVEILISSGVGRWSIGDPAVVKFLKLKGSAQPSHYL